MVFKVYVLFCASAVFIQTISAQCIGNIPGAALAAEEIAFANGALAYGAGAPLVGAAAAGYATAPTLANYGLNFAPITGGTFAVTSSSPISPTGIRVISENAIEGALSVVGELPFLSAVAFESALPSAGAGAINYGCGNGAVGIISESVVPAAQAYGPVGPAYGPVGPAYGSVGPAYGAMGPAATLAPGRLGIGSGLAAQGLSASGLAASGIAANNLAASGLAGSALGISGIAGGLAGPGVAYNGMGYGAI